MLKKSFTAEVCGRINAGEDYGDIGFVLPFEASAAFNINAARLLDLEINESDPDNWIF